MFKILHACIFALALAGPASAFAMQNVPKVCPGVEAVKELPYSRAEVDTYLGWVVMAENSHYATQYEWTTMMLVGNQDDDGNDLDEKSAIAYGNQYLPRVMMAAQAAPEEENGAYWCFYVDKLNDPKSVALTVFPAYQSLGEKLSNLHKINYLFDRSE